MNAAERIKSLKFAEDIKGDYSKTDVVFDCESNGFLDKVTRMWCIVAQDYRTKEFYVFSDEYSYGLPLHGGLEDGVKFLVSCRSIIAHNVAGYDWWLLNKFYPKIFNKKTLPWKRTHDTYTQSKAQWFDRPLRKGIKGNHGLAYYGDLLGYPKPPIEDWSFWDKDKLERCIVDVEINSRTLSYLNQEKKERLEMGIDFSWQTNIAKYTQYWCALQEQNGIRGDRTLMQSHVETLTKLLEELRSEVEPLLPLQTKVNAVKATWQELSDKWSDFYRKVPETQFIKKKKDGEIVDAPVKDTYFPVTEWLGAEPKLAGVFKWRLMSKKKGDTSYTYSKALCKWYELDFDDPAGCDYMIEGDFCKVDLETHYRKYKAGVAKHFGFNEIVIQNEYPDIIGGAFTRVMFEETTLTQHEQVKNYLLSLGWIPTEYNRKKDVYGQFIKNDKGGFVNGSPKLTEDSFDSIPEGVGQKIAEYNTFMHRKRTFINEEDEDKGWLNKLDDSERLHAGANVFATSTGRHSQSGINLAA